MRKYMIRWVIAVFIVVPIMFLLVPLAHGLLVSNGATRGNDSLWDQFLNMGGFYGGYALLAATIAVGLYAWIVRRLPSHRSVTRILYAAAVGICVLLPQAAVFGRGYWGSNIVAGAVAGALYGVLVDLLVDNRRVAT